MHQELKINLIAEATITGLVNEGDSSVSIVVEVVVV